MDFLYIFLVLQQTNYRCKIDKFTDNNHNNTLIIIMLKIFILIIIIIGLRKVYPYYFTFTTFTKGRWVGEKILDVFAREFRAHPVEEYVSNLSRFTLYSRETVVVISSDLSCLIHNDTTKIFI